MYYYLKANSEQELWEALEGAGLAVKDYDPEDEANQRPEDAIDWSPSGAFSWRFTGVALDLIGTIHEPSGNMLTDDEGNEYPEMVALDGYHANLIAESCIEGLPEIVPPNTPYRIWAGQEQ